MKNDNSFPQPQQVKSRAPSKEWNLTAEFIPSLDVARQKLALHTFSTWLARAAARIAGSESNASRSAAHSTQPVLTSHPDNCTVGTPNHCKTGGSDK